MKTTAIIRDMNFKIKRILPAALLASIAVAPAWGGIDRSSVLRRNCPELTAADPLSSLSVGNGSVAMTVDITGLQSFEAFHKAGVPLTTMSAWGWHSMPDTLGLSPEDTEGFAETQNGHGRGLYAVEFKRRKGGKSDSERQIAATAYYRENPHRLNLGLVGFELYDAKGRRLDIGDLKQTHQRLDLETGTIRSTFMTGKGEASRVNVKTTCMDDRDCLLADVESRQLGSGRVRIALRFPYPTLQHSDDAADWNHPEGHSTIIKEQGDGSAVIERRLDGTAYLVRVGWRGEAQLTQTDKHTVVLTPGKKNGGRLQLAVEYVGVSPRIYYCDFADKPLPTDFDAAFDGAAAAWRRYWQRGGFADFSECTAKEAPELERRIVLSQYLMNVNESAPMPPQEAGLTYNTWFGRPHMEMIWWHSLWWSLWNRTDALEAQMKWYEAVEPVCRKIAERQNYRGIRWLKMTDPWGGESPSNVGSFLIWQQPHYIYLAEEIYRRNPSEAVLKKYYDLVMKTAEWMADFVARDTLTGICHLKGCTAMQETLRWTDTYDQPFELEYWRYGLMTAQRWRTRMGEKRIGEWDDIAKSMAPLPESDGIYTAARSYGRLSDSLLTAYSYSDHPAVLGAYGLLPMETTENISAAKMSKTFDRVSDTWNWPTTWGWDYGMTAMTAARLGRPQEAVNALMRGTQKNTYLPNGHNYQDGRLRVYLPGNGALLAAAAMMMAGWDGCTGTTNPGFPKDGTWNVKWEGLNPMQ